MVDEHQLVLQALAYVLVSILGDVMSVYQSAGLAHRGDKGIIVFMKKGLHIHDDNAVQCHMQHWAEKVYQRRVQQLAVLDIFFKKYIDWFLRFAVADDGTPARFDLLAECLNIGAMKEVEFLALVYRFHL